MPMPIVTSEIIESIRTQAQRVADLNLEEQYYAQSLREILDENKNLGEAIIASIGSMTHKFELNANDPKDLNLIVNIFNLCTCIYQSIKQQMVCDELE